MEKLEGCCCSSPWPAPDSTRSEAAEGLEEHEGFSMDNI